jgi:manganese/iron transport system permease protein
VSAYLVDPFSLPFMARALIELCVLGVLGGVVSAFVLLRKLAFAADALTHTVFPGVVIGFVVGGDNGIFVGALIAGAVTAVALTVLTAARRVSSDAALAVLLTAMFSIGVVVVSRQTEYTSDLTTFLFGHVLTVSVPQLVQTAVLAVIVVVTLMLIGKELVFRAFDGVGARAAGYSVGILDLVLNVLVALVVVAAVQAVGTVLVIALLIVPAATARLLADRLPLVVGIGCLVGVLGGYAGLVASFGASVYGGVRLSSGASVVLALVAAYVLALAYAGVRRVVTR